ncbi:MAG: SDR family NAD(P)-dependent oxidoreductase, partial [Chitinophagaceae bacterium]
MEQELATFNLQDKVIVVTGATGILGKAFIKGLSAANAQVVIIGRNEEVGLARESEIRAKGKEALFVKCDVLIKGDLLGARDLVMQKWGRIDGL